MDAMSESSVGTTDDMFTADRDRVPSCAWTLPVFAGAMPQQTIIGA